MGNIATPNIIKASDINDLSINSLTTSGDINCNGNISVPSGSVTANQYYGRKFIVTMIYNGYPETGDYTGLDIRNFEFLIFLIKWHDACWTSDILPIKTPNDALGNSLTTSDSTGIKFINGSYSLVIKFYQIDYRTFSADATGVTWMYLYGLY